MLPDYRLREDDKELLRIVLDYLEIAMAQVHLAAKGVADVEALRVMAVGVQPADHSFVDEVITAALDGAGRRHRTEGPSRPSPRVAGYLATMDSEPRTTSA
jgi:hypothetical protein